MQRVLQFTAQDTVNERRYVLLQQGFLLGGLQFREPKTTDVYRREVSILEKIEALGVIDKDHPIQGVEEGRQLSSVGALSLTQAEYDVLKKYVFAMTWGPAAARYIVDLHEWIEAAERHEEKP